MTRDRALSVTIKDVAREAGVSIATVSHVINKTRYVRPAVEKKVNQVIDRTGYREKILKKVNLLRVGRQSEIAFVTPNIGNTMGSQAAISLSAHLAELGFVLCIYVTEGDLKRERHILSQLATNKRVAGIVLTPASEDRQEYAKLISSGPPFVCLDRQIQDEATDSVLSDNFGAMYEGTLHLVKSGHEKIAILLDSRWGTTSTERLSGYKKGLNDHEIAFRESLVLMIDRDDRSSETAIKEAIERETPSAVIAGGNKLTLTLLSTIEKMGLSCPQDISVVGFGDQEWFSLASPPLTVLRQDIPAMGRLAAEHLLRKIAGASNGRLEARVPVQLSIRKSTQIIGKGPFGEIATSPDELLLSDREIETLRAGDYRVGISFHYCGTAWARLHEAGIRETLQKVGVKVVAVTDAHFDPRLQITQLEGMRMLQPNAVIAIPTDDKTTAEKFKALSKETRLIFISHVPEGFTKQDYAACVSVNEQENGRNAGLLLGELFKHRKKAKVGFINHGAPFYGTRLRDLAAEQVISESYRESVEVVDIKYFYEIPRAYEVCREMLTTHPEIEGLYISWDRPALNAIRALKELGRNEVAVVTFDLDLEIATCMANGEFVKAMSTQRPYEQGVAVGLATAKALLGDEQYKYIGVPPYVVELKNLARAWKEILHERMPATLETALSNLRK
ncbi:MAG: LacI family DNA-binding transcriptional regulator [Verrucomicrobia bacterium]|nr:LacI family DNA-binding transcriptional regulator [Verrucomicrobiota bacterium]